MNAARPVYERAADRVNEAEVAGRIAQAWRCEARKLPAAYRLDYMLLRSGRIMAFMEVKDRPRYAWDYLERFGGYRLSLHKWLAATHMCRDMGKPFALAVRGAGDLRVMVCRSGAEWIPDDLIMAGRNDRGDWQDMEPHVTFAAARFRVRL